MFRRRPHGSLASTIPPSKPLRLGPRFGLTLKAYFSRKSHFLVELRVRSSSHPPRVRPHRRSDLDERDRRTICRPCARCLDRDRVRMLIRGTVRSRVREISTIGTSARGGLLPSGAVHNSSAEPRVRTKEITIRPRVIYAKFLSKSKWSHLSALSTYP